MTDVKSIRRALDVLNCFIHDVREQGVSEIAQELGMNKSTVSRILSTLKAANVVQRSQGNQKYRLGSKVLEWAAIFLSQADLRTTSLSYLGKVKAKTNETVSIVVMEGDIRVCVERINSSEAIRQVINVGERFPLHAGSAGKLLLAYLPEDKRKELIQRTGLPQLTRHTITNEYALERELDTIRQRGVAVSFEERVPLAASVSAAIRNHTDKVIAALSVSGPVPRFSPQKVKEYSLLVKETADKISQELGYQGIMPKGQVHRRILDGEEFSP